MTQRRMRKKREAFVVFFDWAPSQYGTNNRYEENKSSSCWTRLLLSERKAFAWQTAFQRGVCRRICIFGTGAMQIAPALKHGRFVCGISLSGRLIYHFLTSAQTTEHAECVNYTSCKVSSLQPAHQNFCARERVVITRLLKLPFMRRGLGRRPRAALLLRSRVH